MHTDGLLKVICEAIASATKITSIQCRKDALPFTNLFLAKSSKAEHFVDWCRTVILLGSEAKEVEASHFQAMAQVFQVCGDSTIHLYSLGMKRE